VAPMPEEIPTDEEFQEGAAVQVLVNRYERDPAARERCIGYYGTQCVACGVSLAERYGPEMNGLIHVQHLKPLATVGARSIIDPVRDLRPVCPNCHAVIHSTSPARTIQQVQEMMRKQSRKSS
jgi:5-methylcytosine-specific restriction enzyme A